MPMFVVPRHNSDRRHGDPPYAPNAIQIVCGAKILIILHCEQAEIFDCMLFTMAKLRLLDINRVVLEIEHLQTTVDPGDLGGVINPRELLFIRNYSYV